MEVPYAAAQYMIKRIDPVFQFLPCDIKISAKGVVHESFMIHAMFY